MANVVVSAMQRRRWLPVARTGGGVRTHAQTGGHCLCARGRRGDGSSVELTLVVEEARGVQSVAEETGGVQSRTGAERCWRVVDEEEAWARV